MQTKLVGSVGTAVYFVALFIHTGKFCASQVATQIVHCGAPVFHDTMNPLSHFMLLLLAGVANSVSGHALPLGWLFVRMRISR